MRNQTCKYFEQGRCFKGSNCKFAHISPSDNQLTKFTSSSHLVALSNEIKNDLKEFGNFESKTFSSLGFPSPATTNLIDGSRELSFEELRVQFYQDPTTYNSFIQQREEDYKKVLDFLKQNYDKAARYLQLAAKGENKLKPFIPFSGMNPSFGSSGFGGSGTPAFGSSGFGQSGFGQSGFGQSAFGKSAFSQNDTAQKSSPFGGLAENKGNATPFGSNSAFAGSNPFAKAASSTSAFGGGSSSSLTGSNPFAKAAPSDNAFGGAPFNNAFAASAPSTNAFSGAASSNAFSSGGSFPSGNAFADKSAENAFSGASSKDGSFPQGFNANNAFSAGEPSNNAVFSGNASSNSFPTASNGAGPSVNKLGPASENIPEAVMAAFQSATFELGKVPDVPPPASLCQG